MSCALALVVVGAVCGAGVAGAAPDGPSSAVEASAVTAERAQDQDSQDSGPGGADDLVGVAGERELGIRLGAAMGTGLSPGGVHLVGVLLYQMSRRDWFEGNLGFTFGRNQAGCFNDRDGTFTCDHGIADGAGIGLTAGVRRFLRPQQRFAPYVRAGLGVRLAQFRADDVRGVAIPVVAGVGVRAQINAVVAVGADVEATAAVGWYGRGLGADATLGLAVQISAEFRLD